MLSQSIDILLMLLRLPLTVPQQSVLSRFGQVKTESMPDAFYGSKESVVTLDETAEDATPIPDH